MNKIFLVFIISIFGGCFQILDLETPPKAIKGFLDLSTAQMNSEEVVKLDGEWEFYWNRFLYSGKSDQTNKNTDFIYSKVPGNWNGEIVNGKELPGYGYGTYRLKLILPEGNDTFALKTPDLATSYRIWFNGELLTENGFISDKAETFKPQFLVGISYIRNPKLENEIVVEIANFAHVKGGFWESMRIGTNKGIHDFREKKFGFDLFLTGSLLIMGIYHIGLFSLRRNDRSSLWLGVFCFIMIVRTLTTGERLLFSYFPDINFEFGLKLEYLSFFLATPVFSMFLNSLYPEEFKSKPLKIILFSSSIFILLVFFSFVNIYSRSAIPYQLVTVSSLIYGITALVKGSIRKREGAFVALIGFLVLFATIINDILYANVVINTAQLSPFGLFVFIFSQAFLLSIRFSKAFFNVELLSQDLSKTNVAYSRFVPKEFLSFLQKQNITDVMLGDQIQKDMTILFSDIRSFTELSENMNPEENFNFINEYLSLMNPIIRKYNGFIDKYIGDAIMALFPESPDDAMNAAIEMINSLKEFNEKRISESKVPIKIGIGIHTGSLMLGTVGDSERMEGTVISDAVNLASRIEGLTKVYGALIVASEITLYNLKHPEKYKFRFLGKVAVKGKKDPAPIFEVFESDEDQTKNKKADSKVHFELAINAFFKGEKESALKIFEEIFAVNNSDMAAFHYIQNCKTSKNIEIHED
ncbi:MAG: adenylate/guanylate cyclase domain-containing protein [Leptospiraceae bacterium]|nr:adenylate/guanylate cyclase domain-containing protein [Leptospiraceae bacterium]